MYNHTFKPTVPQLEAKTSLESLGFEVLVLSGKIIFCNEEEILKVSEKKVLQEEAQKAEYEGYLKIFTHYKNNGLI